MGRLTNVVQWVLCKPPSGHRRRARGTDAHHLYLSGRFFWSKLTVDCVRLKRPEGRRWLTPTLHAPVEFDTELLTFEHPH